MLETKPTTANPFIGYYAQALHSFARTLTTLKIVISRSLNSKKEITDGMRAREGSPISTKFYP